eukprot:CAMPEP_0114991190 /NCGR_PEP_ID=MMETSP0216-20121206/11222_1 /TAXON_ID=223996 /ORGANISM="Protocruzia adherens, Strain Boccale" /LENGTH=51 /DNA_ID=CAMNT_0002354465 /DNA_START=234 /DNA_END=389 /DNA_ORIENTATION=-
MESDITPVRDFDGSGDFTDDREWGVVFVVEFETFLAHWGDFGEGAVLDGLA